jgi:hypothetical protein
VLSGEDVHNILPCFIGMKGVCVDLYLEPVGGISGDMFLGALVALGADAEEMFAPLVKTDLGFDWRVEDVRRGAISAKHVVISTPHEHHHRGLEDILEIVNVLDLPGEVKERADSAFKLLAKAEAAVHGVSVDEVHFHEVGAVDSITDVIAGFFGCHLLGVSKVYTAPVPLGSGWINTTHGKLPVPAPATMSLMEGIPALLGDDREGELTTPTGALMLKVLGATALPAASFVFHKTAYGAGTRNPEDYPNVLRASLVEIVSGPTAAGEVVRMETAIDNMTPEALGFLRERLEEAGALEVGYVAQAMKKGRPGVLVTILCPHETSIAVRKALFTHSSTIGVRWWPVWREVLERELLKVQTPFGPVGVKKVIVDGKARFSVEYEDAARLAKEACVPLSEIVDAAIAAADGLR